MTIDVSEINVAVVGAGRMGRGIALSYALAGATATLLDIKDRPADARASLINANDAAIRADIAALARLGLITAQGGERIVARITTISGDRARAAAAKASLVFEGVPEHREAKQSAFRWMDENTAKDAIIASTTSTFLVDDLAAMISNPSRFANAHWLNPAHLMPLVEISKGGSTSAATIERLRDLLHAIGKTTIVCGPTPGYIVPRIQALAMNEAARLVEEGAASAEDIDHAIRVGFGVRYAILGLLEFIDWGGGDILYYASDYLSKTVDKDRYAAPAIIHANMNEGRNGVADGKGFYDYSNIDVASYRLQRMKEFTALLAHLRLTPKIAPDARE